MISNRSRLWFTKRSPEAFQGFSGFFCMQDEVCLRSCRVPIGSSHIRHAVIVFGLPRQLEVYRGSGSGLRTCLRHVLPWRRAFTRSGSANSLQELGHEVILANVRERRSISHCDRKSDQVDSEKLARYACLDPNILRPIPHRTVRQHEALTLNPCARAYGPATHCGGELRSRTDEGLQLSYAGVLHPMFCSALPAGMWLEPSPHTASDCERLTDKPELSLNW